MVTRSADQSSFRASTTPTNRKPSSSGRRNVVPGQTFNQHVPSIAERNGDFSDVGGPNLVTDPTYATQYANNQAVSQALLGMIPAPNGSNAQNCAPPDCVFNASPAQGTQWREELIRVDHNFSEKIRSTFRFIHDSWQTTTAVPLWTNQGSFPTIQTAFKGPGVGLVFRLTATASPTLLNEFVFSYTADHIVLNDVGNWKR